MKKRIFILFATAIAVLGVTQNVYASEDVFYTTPKGIELTEEEYKFLTTFYWDGYPDIMTEAQYEEFAASDLLTRKLTVKRYEESIGLSGNSPRSTSHDTPAKGIQIGSACSTDCVTSIVATWHGSPSVRSYDVIGAYLSGVSLLQHSTTYVYSTAGLVYYNNLITASNGIGNSVLLPSTGDNIVINMIFRTTTNGTIYGSYQHAMQSTTLPVSQMYNFSLGGYGSVFAFYGIPDNYQIYDGMSGVEIDV